MAWVATLPDFFAHGLPPSACTPEARSVESVDPTTGIFELSGHGLFGGELVRLRAKGSGAALPHNADRLKYYTVAPPPGPDFFSLLYQGSAVTFTDAGTGLIQVIENPVPWILAILGAVSSYVVAHHKASAGPWTTPPGWAPRVVGHLAAVDVAVRLRVTSPQYSLEALQKRAEVAEAFLLRAAAGEPYEDGVGPVDGTPNLQEAGAAAWADQDRGISAGDLR